MLHLPGSCHLTSHPFGDLAGSGSECQFLDGFHALTPLTPVKPSVWEEESSSVTLPPNWVSQWQSLCRHLSVTRFPSTHRRACPFTPSASYWRACRSRCPRLRGRLLSGCPLLPSASPSRTDTCRRPGPMLFLFVPIYWAVDLTQSKSLERARL